MRTNRYPSPSSRVGAHHEGYLLVLMMCDHFLYRMCRRIVGALVEVGKGRLLPEEVRGVKRAAVPTAPAQGLCLDVVRFPARFGSLVSDDIPEIAAPSWP